jgi:hypothetical protein
MIYSAVKLLRKLMNVGQAGDSQACRIRVKLGKLLSSDCRSNRYFQFTDVERFALDFVVALGSDVILRVNQHAKLTHVEFRDQNPTVSM